MTMYYSEVDGAEPTACPDSCASEPLFRRLPPALSGCVNGTRRAEAP